MYDVRRLLLIRDLAEHGTLGAVSELHGITTSAVSQQLRALEQEAGSALLRRDGRVLRLTHAGQVLVRHAAKVLQALDEAESAVAAAREGTSGTVTLVGFRTALMALARPLLERVRHSEVKLRLVTAIKEPALNALRAGEADLAITYHYSFRSQALPDGLESEFLVADPLVLLAPPPAHAGVERDGLSALAEADWIAASEGAPSIDSLLHNCRAAGFTPQIAHRIDNFGDMARLVEAGAGVTIVPRLAVPRELSHLVANSVAHGTRQISVSRRRGTAGHPAVATVVHALKAVIRVRAPAPLP
ncbi:LysR family transcriptional regulator [Amycolatopsis thermoflava]|uniref:LysR family transcriptional regulator n=1 Tax=Amycolatopsis thermoflava TaxID=84480 RepID=UPI00381129F5